MPMYERLDKICQSLLIALFGLLPFFFVPHSLVSVAQSKIILSALVLLVIAILWPIARVLEGSIRIPWSIIIPAAALVPLSYALSSALTGFQTISLVGSGVEADTFATICLAFGALALAATVFLGKEKYASLALRAFLGGGLLLCLIQIFHIAFPSITIGPIAGEAGNAFASWHDFAFLMGVMAFLAVTVRETAVFDRYSRFLPYALIALAVPLLVLANFRDVWILLGGAFLAYILACAFNTGDLWSPRFWLRHSPELAGILLAIVFALFGTFFTALLPDRIRVEQIEVRPSVVGTLAIGQQSLQSPLELLFGSGPNTFQKEWGLYKPLDVNRTPFWNADFSTGVAAIPTSFITTGLIGALSWMLFIAAVLFVVVRFWIRDFSNPERMPVLAFSLAGLACIAFHLVSIPGSSVLIITFLSIGILIPFLPQTGIREVSLSIRSFKNAILAAAIVVILLLTIFTSVAASRAVFSEILINRAIAIYNATKNLERSTALIGFALAVQSGSDRAHRAAVQLGLLKLKELVANTDPAAALEAQQLQDTLKVTIQHGLDAVEINDGDYRNWLELAALYGELAGANIEGAYDNARAAYERAAKENPSNPLPFINLAQLEFLEGNYAAALTNFEEAIRLKSDLAAAHFIGSQIFAAQRNFARAIPEAERAAELAPDDSQSWYNLGVIAYAGEAYSLAAPAFEQALVREPRFANALYMLGLSYYRLDRRESAIAVFEALDALDPGHAVVKDILSNLQRGRPVPQASVAETAPRR